MLPHLKCIRYRKLEKLEAAASNSAKASRFDSGLRVRKEKRFFPLAKTIILEVKMKLELVENEYYYIKEDEEIVDYLQYRNGFFYRKSERIYSIEEIKENAFRVIKEGQE